MQIRFLGTSSGTPTLSRNVSGLALQPRQSRGWYLVDCGEGTQHQVLRSPLSLANLRGIFITHVHGDHCYGLPGLLASAGLNGRREPLVLVAPRPVQALLQAVCAHTDLHLGFDIDFRGVDEAPTSATVWEDGELTATAHPLSHRVPSFAYAFTRRPAAPGLDTGQLAALGVPQGPLWGRLQRGEAIELATGEQVHPAQVTRPPPAPQRIVVAGDNDDPALMAACGPADAWVHEATYTEDVLAKVGPGPQHSSAARVARAATAQALPNLVLTHFSARYADTAAKAGSPSVADLEAEARAHYVGRLFMASDHTVLVLDGQGRLSPLA